MDILKQKHLDELKMRGAKRNRELEQEAGAEIPCMLHSSAEFVLKRRDDCDDLIGVSNFKQYFTTSYRCNQAAEGWLVTDVSVDALSLKFSG